MSTRLYNVIWADDECATLKKDKGIRELFDRNLIEVLEFVPTSEKLRDALERYKDRVDAVIVDGNFPRNDEEYVSPTDISGLVHTLSIIELFNAKRDIPFFLYTSKKIFLQEICKNKELEYFTKNDRFIQKGELSALVNKIIEAVNHINSVEFMVKKKYKVFLEMAKEADEQCEGNLYNFLLDEAKDTKYDKAEHMFNHLRLVLEQIQGLCIKEMIIPEQVATLTNFKHFFRYSTKKNQEGWDGHKANGVTYKPIDGIMPITIAHSLGTLIDILQDGSHKKADLNLNVSQYTFETRSPFLFRACLYLVMDVIRWFNKLSHDLRSGAIDPLKLFTTETNQARTTIANNNMDNNM